MIPKSISLFGIVDLHFYGLMYALAVMSAYFFTPFFAHKRGLSLSRETTADLLFWTMIGGVLGGRFFYVLVYNFSFFWEHPGDILAVWKGGMSIHGGLLGGALGFFLFCKKEKKDLWALADVFAPALALGLAFGRLGNFVNGELFGRPSDVFWAMDFGDGILRHPAQLYAMAKDIVLFFLLVFLGLRFTMQKGMLMMSFFLVLSLFRFGVEFFREPDSQIGFLLFHLSMGQWLSVGLFFLSLGGFWALHRK